MTITRCRACLAWDPFEPTDGRDTHYAEAKGWCRRFAPRAGLAGTSSGEEGEIWAAFPMTQNADGCCEGVPDVYGPHRVTGEAGGA